MRKPTAKQLVKANDRKFLEDDLQASNTRARSVTVGTCFGGTSELSMRMNSGVTVWAALQPVEVVELIHQLAANIGCHMQLIPRHDFASFRNWKVSDAELEHFRGQQFWPAVGYPPHAKGVEHAIPIGKSDDVSKREIERILAREKFEAEKQSMLQGTQNAMATPETVNERTPEQPAASA